MKCTPYSYLTIQRPIRHPGVRYPQEESDVLRSPSTAASFDRKPGDGVERGGCVLRMFRASNKPPALCTWSGLFRIFLQELHPVQKCLNI